MTLTSHPVDSLKGTFDVPGDKSISHRSLMFGACALGTTTVTGLLEGEDVLATAAAMRAMGATIEQDGDTWQITGVGTSGLQEPANVLDMGNSGTSARLLMGLIAPFEFNVIMTGDASLRKRPMGRVTNPLSQMGARFTGRVSASEKLPIFIQGAGQQALPITYELPVASAQVKSAVLLAGLNTPGETTVIEPIKTRDHTERMLKAFGADIKRVGDAITVQGYAQLQAVDVAVPRDPSSAAFPMVAALITPNSEVTLPSIGLNPLRTGLLQTLQEMGGDIRIMNQREAGGEPVGDITVKTSALQGVTVPADRAPSMIDEFPILAVAAAFANGITKFIGVEELRVKESDRLAAMETGLRACGVNVSTTEDSMTIVGDGTAPAGGGQDTKLAITTHLDHRIAMSFAVLGMAAKNAVVIDDAAPIATSFPDFITGMGKLGATLKQ